MLQVSLQQQQCQQRAGLGEVILGEQFGYPVEAPGHHLDPPRVKALAHGVETRLIRIFNTYGPRMDPNDGRVISNFITQALRGEPLTIYGDGSQTRSFCFRDDLIEGMIRLMNHPNNELGPVNVGNPNEKTMLELAEAVLAATGSSSKMAQTK